MNNGERTFYTVAEAAEVLRVGTATIYRAIREDAFPAVKLRGRCLIPVTAINVLIEQASTTGACVDIAEIAREWRIQREFRTIEVGSGRQREDRGHGHGGRVRGH